MSEHPFDRFGTGWILLFTIVTLLLAAQLGFWLGRRHRGESLETKKSHTGTQVGALLGLLGLMLAFSFGIVESRFSARKALVLEEANAIGTTYLRAEMLPAPHRERIQELLRQYVDARTVPGGIVAAQRAIERSGEQHRELWAEAVVVATANPESEIASIFVQALNQMIDLHESRVTVGLHQRLPLPILLTLYVVSVLSLGLLGFNSGLVRWRSLLPTTAVVLAVSSVVVLIVELDRPTGRLVSVNQSALKDLQDTISQDYGTPRADSGR